MTGAPDLSTPETRAAYRRELRGVARGVRISGLTFAVLGVAFGATRFFVDPWPIWLRIVALVLCVVGLALIGVGVFQRTRYHLARMAGTDASDA
jgi:membrane protein YdbS with pleckstrin-like domain